MSNQSAVRISMVLMLALGCVRTCPADTILDGSTLDESELIELGIDPSAFLFTGNTMYDFNGTDELNIIGAEIDPLTTQMLEGVPTQSIIVELDNQGSGGSAVLDSNNAGSDNSETDLPEPSAAALVLAGGILVLACCWFFRRFRLRRTSTGR